MATSTNLKDITAAEPLITLTTDFGTRDHYVGAMKGVIAGLAPHSRVVDICHEIAAQDVRHGSFVLWQAFRWFPAGTIHIAVVDPGVGTARRVLLGRFAGHYILAPDNGLLTLVHGEFGAEALIAVENRAFFAQRVSATFHGRDVFSPAAAHLASGVPMQAFGPPTDRIELLPVMNRAELREGRIRGGVLHVDHFGTLVTNVHRDQLFALGRPFEELEVWCGGRCVGSIRATFADVSISESEALVGSADLLEIAVNRGRAADVFGSGDDLVIEVRTK